MTSSFSARYENDFCECSMQRAALVRTLARSRLDVDIDRTNIAEEIEGMGKAGRRAVGSRLRRIFCHLPKLRHSPATEPRRGWQNSVDDARMRLAEHLEDSPSLVHDMAGSIEHRYTLARRRALRGMGGRYRSPPGTGNVPLHRGADTRFRLVAGVAEASACVSLGPMAPCDGDTSPNTALKK